MRIIGEHEANTSKRHMADSDSDTDESLPELIASSSSEADSDEEASSIRAAQVAPVSASCVLAPVRPCKSARMDSCLTRMCTRLCSELMLPLLWHNQLQQRQSPQQRIRRRLPRRLPNHLL